MALAVFSGLHEKRLLHFFLHTLGFRHDNYCWLNANGLLVDDFFVFGFDLFVSNRLSHLAGATILTRAPQFFNFDGENF